MALLPPSRPAGTFSNAGRCAPATVEAVARLEDSGLFNAGCGSTPTTEGIIETDASVMDGASGAAGAVCAATWPANPVRAALIVATHGQADPFFDPSRPRAPIPGVAVVATPGDGGPAWYPVLLAGAGADSVAKAAGLAKMASGTTPLANEVRPRDFTSPGTVGAVALDGSGHVAAATSTGGRPVKPPGRVGDSSIIGAGTWADDATAAVSGTGTGEAFIVAGFAHHVDWAIRGGSSLDHALTTALKGVSGRDGTGGAIAISASGQFAAIFGTPAMARGWKSAAKWSCALSRTVHLRGPPGAFLGAPRMAGYSMPQTTLPHTTLVALPRCAGVCASSQNPRPPGGRLELRGGDFSRRPFDSAQCSLCCVSTRVGGRDSSAFGPASGRKYLSVSRRGREDP